MSIGSLLLEGYSWMGAELPSFPGAALSWGVSPCLPIDQAGLDGQEAKHGCGRSSLTLAAVLSRDHAVAYTPGQSQPTLPGLLLGSPNLYSRCCQQKSRSHRNYKQKHVLK